MRRASALVPALDAVGIVKRFGTTLALDRVDLRVDVGTIHGLVGPNGAGKTTLLAGLFGLIQLDEGTLRLFGKTRESAGPAWLDHVAGFVESPRFYPYLSGRRNLTILAALDAGGSEEAIDHLLDSLGLSKVARQKSGDYSLGMRQRLGLAAALLRRPRLLILDEPANGLDPAGVSDLYGLLREMARKGMTVIVSSHDIAALERVSDDVTVLNRGEVVFSGSIDAMRATAPDGVWRVHTSNDPAALLVAERRQTLNVGTHEDGGLTVLGSEEDLDDFVISLGLAGIAVRGLSQSATPLVSLFRQLTGHSEPQIA